MGEQKKFKINFFDIVIIAIVIIAGAVVYTLTHKEAVLETTNIRYTIEINDKDPGFTDLIHEGDELYDNIKNYYMGKVVSVEEVPYKKLFNDYENGGKVESEVPGRVSAVIVVEAPVTETAADFKVNGNFLVKAGLEIAVKGKGYAGEGYILTIER